MPELIRPSHLVLLLVLPCAVVACSDDEGERPVSDGTGDGDGDGTGDGDGDETGDGDGDGTGDGDGDGTGDGDGDETGDGDGDETGDGDGCDNPTETVEFDQLLATTQILPFPLSGVSPATHFMLTEQPELGPDDRIYLYADYYIPGQPWSGFQFILFSLSGECSLNMVAELDGTPLVAHDIIDNSEGLQTPILQAPFMGAGEGLNDQGINVWDVSDIQPGDADCGPTVFESVDYQPNTNHFVFWEYSSVLRVVRAFRLYRGHVVETCP